MVRQPGRERVQHHQVRRARAASEIMDTERHAAAMPELCVVVISTEADPRLLAAIRSLQAQDVPLEILLVNSGGGGPRELLARHGMDIPVVDLPQRVYVGAARNHGIRASRAPYVAFLAADCRARPGWARVRLARHRAGQMAVASAMVNSKPRSLISAAYHLVLFMRRLPRLPAQRAIRYGASYRREIFECCGLFAEDMRSGEDSDFLARLPSSATPEWCPEILTEHDNDIGFFRAIAEMFGRGRRYAREAARVKGLSRREIVRQGLRDLQRVHWFASMGLDAEELSIAKRAMPFFHCLMLARMAGVLVARSPAAQPATPQEVRA